MRRGKGEKHTKEGGEGLKSRGEMGEGESESGRTDLKPELAKPRGH